MWFEAAMSRQTTSALADVLSRLRRLDDYNFFQAEIPAHLAPDYYDVITEPMWFERMRQVSFPLSCSRADLANVPYLLPFVERWGENSPPWASWATTFNFELWTL